MTTTDADWEIEVGHEDRVGGSVTIGLTNNAVDEAYYVCSGEPVSWDGMWENSRLTRAELVELRDALTRHIAQTETGGPA